MQIYVNEQKFDAILNEEKNLKEVYDSLQMWVEKNKRYILGMKADQRELNVNALEKIHIDKVKRLDFYIGDELDMLLSSVEELDQYIDQVGSTLFDKKEIEVVEQGNLQEGLKWIREILKSIFSILGLEPNLITVNTPDSENFKNTHTINQILDQLEHEVQSFLDQHDEREIENFLETLRSLKYYTMRLNMQLKSMGAKPAELVEILKDFEKKIPVLKEELVAINSNFQKGQETKALELLSLITTQLNLSISALYAIDFKAQQKGDSTLTELSIEHHLGSNSKEILSFHKVVADFTILLENLSNSLEIGDIVALGDILEYELTERLDILKPYISKILEMFENRLALGLIS